MKTAYRILAKDHFMSNNTRETGLSNNDCIIGPTGSYKTRGYVKPNILQFNEESMIIADSKGSLIKELSRQLKDRGYKIINIDFADCENSYGYNPFDYIRYDEVADKYNAQDIKTIATNVIPIENNKDPFWDLATKMVLESIIGYVVECLPEREHNFDSVIKLACEMGSGKFESLMEELLASNPNSFAGRQYGLYKSTVKADKMYASIQGVLAEKLSMLSFDGALEMFKKSNRINFADIGREKTVVFVNMNDTDRSMDKLGNLFYSQLLHNLCYTADRNKGYRLDVPVRIILDDFANSIVIPDFDKIASMVRSREIYVSIILQSISQLEGMYGLAKATTIINNCDNMLYLGGQDVETARMIGIKANKSISTILNMPLSQAWLFTRGQEPKQVEKFQLEEHKNYKELREGQIEEVYHREEISNHCPKVS